MTEKKMLSDYPKLVEEWDFEKNADLNIDDFSYGSNQKVGWKCNQGHFWDAVISNRTLRNGNCRKCSSNSQKKRLSDYKNLLKEFSDENELSPDEIRVSDRGLRVWVCLDEHKWKSSVKDRIFNNAKCPICESPEKFLISYKILMKEWDYDNNTVDPFFLTIGSSKFKVWWKCLSCDKRWEASVSNRVKRNTGCPYCHKRTHMAKQQEKSLLKYGSIADSELISEWNYDKNILNPDQVSVKSVQYVWWKCKMSHEWEAKPNLRTNRKFECPYCASRKHIDAHYLSKINNGEKSFFGVASDKLKNEWFDEKYDPQKILPYSHTRIRWKCSKGHIWRTAPGNRLNGRGCPDCWNSTYVSAGEQEVLDYIRSMYNGEIKSSSRKTIYPYELDIYLSDLNIAFEFNGIYWHREDMLAQRIPDPKNYHFNKWKMCHDKGIQLITIWEDDWRDNQSMMKNMIAHKIGFSQKEKIGARKTTIKEISSKEAKEFLNTNHIQGSINGLSIGLFSKDKDDLLAVSVFKKKNTDELELLRYASSSIVQGGLGKILSFVENSNPNIKYITTFADHGVSDGNLYVKTGFKIDKILKSDYKYIYRNKRYHKFLFRKKRFEKDDELLFDENMTEKELADLNKIYRIWDCGKTKYIKSINENRKGFCSR